jgi:hypothetical protein
MSQNLDTSPAVIGIDIGENSFHIVGQNQRGAILLRHGRVARWRRDSPICRRVGSAWSLDQLR